MRIWCVPSATELESPKLPPRIDRDVYLRSPPPPPRLSKEQKLARGVIVVKPPSNKKSRKSRKASSSSSSKSTLDSPPPPLAPRVSPSSSNNNGSTLRTNYSDRKYYKNTFKAHINNGGSVTNSSLILHPGTSRSRQKKIKKRKRGEIWKNHLTNANPHTML